MSEPFGPTRTPADPPSTPGAVAAAAPFEREHEPATMSAFAPILIMGLVLLAWFVFQANQLRAERDAIREAMTSQARQLDESKKLRDAFYAIAHGAEVLADGGNPSARLIVDGLKKRGITITPNPPPTTDKPAP